jgi:hypothetical protein
MISIPRELFLSCKEKTKKPPNAAKIPKNRETVNTPACPGFGGAEKRGFPRLVFRIPFHPKRKAAT